MKEKAFKITAIISLTYLIIITSFYIPYYSNNIYEKHFENAYLTLGEEKTNTVFNNLKEYLDKDYFGYDRTHLLSEFTLNEQSHMKDVKRIFDWLHLLYYASIILLIISVSPSIKKKKQLTKLLKAAGFASLIVIALIALSSLINFTSAFTLFHKIFFPMGNWQFPTDSILITLFPQEFFKEFALTVSAISIILSLVFIAIGYSKNLKQVKKLIKKD